MQKKPRRHWRAAPEKQAPKNAHRFVLYGMLGAVVLAIGIPWAIRQPKPLPSQSPIAPVAAAPQAAAPAEDVPPAESAARPFVEAAALGGEAYRNGDYEGALAQFRAAIEKNPADAEAQSNLGQVLVRLKRVDEALPHFDRAISLIPTRWA